MQTSGNQPPTCAKTAETILRWHSASLGSAARIGKQLCRLREKPLSKQHRRRRLSTPPVDVQSVQSGAIFGRFLSDILHTNCSKAAWQLTLYTVYTLYSMYALYFVWGSTRTMYKQSVCTPPIGAIANSSLLVVQKSNFLQDFEISIFSQPMTPVRTAT